MESWIRLVLVTPAVKENIEEGLVEYTCEKSDPVKRYNISVLTSVLLKKQIRIFKNYSKNLRY